MSHINWQPVLNDVSSEQVYFGPQMDSVQSVEYDESPSDVGCPNSEVLAPIIIDSVYDQQATSPPPLNSMDQLPSPTETDSERFPEVLPILRRLGILFTAAPPWIQQHFSSLEVDIPQASPDAVFEYFSKNSCQANRVSGKFPCELQDTAFEDDGSFKTFVRYITKKEIVEDDENPYSCTVFISSPFNLPLLLTADGFLRVFTDNQKVIASSHCGIFSSESERFLHPELLELKLDPKYFLEPSPNNLELISIVLDSTLDRSLCCARLKSASFFIPTKVLKRLWTCLTKDPLFKKHTKDIVQRWALILSDKDELFRYDPKHASLMPVAAPCKPKRSPNETPPSQEDEQEYHIHLKLYDIFRANGMPTLNFKVKHYCPSFQNPESILINLYHLYKQQEGGSDVPTTVADTMLVHNNIPEIFAYFSQINFAKDKGQGCLLRNLLRSLPLFMSKDGRYHCLQGNVYLWPQYICLDGLAELLSETSTVFLPKDGMWTEFSTDTIGATSIHHMKLYVDYLFPCFHLLSEGDRLKQLEHIRDTEELFEAAHMKCKAKGLSSEVAESIEKEFLEGLGRLPIIMNNGELACIGEFCDPRNSVFKHFPDKYSILPDAFNDNKWLSFFEEIGLKMKPTFGEYKEFCHHVSSGNHSDIINASQALLDCLFKTHDWHMEESFLHEIREISFVCVDALDQYSGIHPASTANVKVVPQQDGVSVRLTCLKKCINYKHASLTWTIHPVVHLPAEITVPPIKIFLQRFQRNHYEKVFMEHLCVLMEPSPSDVLKNIRSISQSCFSNFKLFDCYSDEYITKNENSSGLVEIVKENLSYLDKMLTEKSQSDTGSQQSEVDLTELSSLQFIPCIPVCSDCTGDVSRPVLVKPLQAVYKLPEDLRAPLHPFLCSIPEKIGYLKVFDHIGVNPHPQLSNVLHALELINTHAETPFNHNTTKSVTVLLKRLYEHLSFKSSVAFKGNEILYLPSEDGKLVKSTHLIYNDMDKIVYRNGEFNLSSIPNCEYAMVSLLCHQHDEIQKYGFRLSDLITKLPAGVCPIPLSKYCDEKLHNDCQTLETMSPFAEELERNLTSSKFVEVVDLVISTKNSLMTENCVQFVSSLRMLLQSMKVYTVSNLKIDLVFKKKHIIGTVDVDFFLERNDEGQSTLFVAEKYFQWRAHEHVVRCILNEASDHSSLVMEEVREIMGVLLSGGPTYSIKMFLNCMNINPSLLKLGNELDYESKTPVVGEKIPEELFHRLRADISNRFKPQEIVGYETSTEGCFIYARVESQVTSEDKSSELDEYCISTGEGEVIASVIDLHKILSIKGAGDELVLYDPSSGEGELWDSLKGMELEEVTGMISKRLKAICEIQDEDKRRKALDAEYLKWHAEEEEMDNSLPSKAFRFLRNQLQNIKDGKRIGDLLDEADVPLPCSDRCKEIVRRRKVCRVKEQCLVMDLSPPVIDKELAAAWITQAKHDKRATEVMYAAAQRNVEDKLCAHVCFLAHQVVEKSLKAGMYCTFGLTYNDLHSHPFNHFAKQLQTVCPPTPTAPLAELAAYFGGNFYVKSRYPNACGDRAPAECFTLDEATKAVQKSSEIFEAVNKYITHT